MNSVVATISDLLPIVLIVLAGGWLARRKVIAGEVSKPLCDLAFLLFIPAYLFPEIYGADLGQLFDVTAILTYAVVALTGMAMVGALCLCWTELGAGDIALRMMAAAQVNTAYFAIPVFVQLFDDATPILPVLVLQVTVQTVLVLAILEFAASRHDTERHPAKTVLRSVGSALATPVVVICVTAIALNALSLPVPEQVLSGLSFAGAAASPVALIALGLYLGGSTLRLRGATPDENVIIVCKCIVFPLMVFVVAKYVVRLDDPWLGYLTLLSAMPTPQNVFILAGRYGGDIDFSGSVVVKTTLVSLLLLPAWTFFAL